VVKGGRQPVGSEVSEAALKCKPVVGGIKVADKLREERCSTSEICEVFRELRAAARFEQTQDRVAPAFPLVEGSTHGIR
jgi:hypothetical protein